MTETAECCRKCGSAVTAESAVRLWDDETYCRVCVDHACPGMSEYAAAHPRLFEQTPFHLGRFVVAAILWMLLVGLIFVTVVLSLGDEPLSANLVTELLHSVLVAGAIVTPFRLFLKAVEHVTIYVSAENGRLRPRGGPIGEYAWYHLERPAACWKKAIDLFESQTPCVWLLPTCSKFTRRSYHCAYSPETERIWLGFLTLALGLPRDSKSVQPQDVHAYDRDNSYSTSLAICLAGIATGGTLIAHLAFSLPRDGRLSAGTLIWVATSTIAALLAGGGTGWLWGCRLVRRGRPLAPLTLLPATLLIAVVALEQYHGGPVRTLFDVLQFGAVVVGVLTIPFWLRNRGVL